MDKDAIVRLRYLCTVPTHSPESLEELQGLVEELVKELQGLVEGLIKELQGRFEELIATRFFGRLERR